MKFENRVHQLLFTLGHAYLDVQQFKEAYEKFEQLHRAVPEDPEVAQYLATSSIRLNNVSQEALEIYESSLSLNPDSEQLISLLAALFVKNNISTPFAIEVCEKAMGASFGDKEQLLGFLKKHRITLDPKNGKSEKNKTPISLQDKTTIHPQLEKLWWDGQFNEAFELLERVEQDFPDYENYRKDLALTHAYAALDKKRFVSDESVMNTIYDESENMSPADSLNELRDYLTLRLSLPDNFDFQRNKSSDHDEYEFYLGLISAEDFFCDTKKRQIDAGNITKFDLNKEALNPLEKVAEWQEENEDTGLDWRGFLFAQAYLADGNSVPQKLLELVGSYLYKIQNSVLRHTDSGFISLATDSLSQIKAVVKLFHSLEKYNSAADNSSRIFIRCGIVILPDVQRNGEPGIHEALVGAAHLLRFTERHFQKNCTSSKLLLQAEESTLELVETHNFCTMPVGNPDILSSGAVNCVEVIWEDPLAHISKKQGYEFGDYEIQQRLLQHNSYATYLGVDRRFGRRVIIKVISPQNTIRCKQHESELAQLYDSIRTIGRMHHPNIATIFDMGEHEGMIFFVREYVEGKPIIEFGFSNAGWEYDLVTAWLKIVRALMYAESQGITHLNFKTENIWLAEGQGPKITDFRITGLESEQDSSEVTFPPHWKYLAPEVLSNENGDTRSDVYSIGIMLYEIIAQHHPYDNVGEIEAPEDLLIIEIAPLVNQEKPHHEAWREFITKAIHADAGKRFQTLKEVERELQKIQVELAHKRQVV